MRLVTCHTTLSAAAKLGSYTARIDTGAFGNAHFQQPPRFRVSNANSFCQLSNFRCGMTQRSDPLYAIPRDSVQECRPSLFFTSSLLQYTAFLRDHAHSPWSQQGELILRQPPVYGLLSQRHEYIPMATATMNIYLWLRPP
jgi:hypothetical protein